MLLSAAAPLFLFCILARIARFVLERRVFKLAPASLSIALFAASDKRYSWLAMAAAAIGLFACTMF